MSIGTILLIILILVLLGVLPTWPHSRGWGYYPSGGIGLILIIIIVLLLLGRLKRPRPRSSAALRRRGPSDEAVSARERAARLSARAVRP